jgi:hypothetical protein
LSRALAAPFLPPVAKALRLFHTEAFNKMNAPAERMEAPTDVDTVTYATADLTETIQVVGQYGARFLTAEEIRSGMPQYPL